MNTSTSSIPRELPTLVTFRYHGQTACVPLAASHEEAQDIAARTFPDSLADVDPSWLRFSIAVRYKRTGERKEHDIMPESWHYVTSRLVPYRCIDIRVVPPPSPRRDSSSSSSSSSILETPPQGDAPLYPESPSRHPEQLYAKHDRPLYPESPRSTSHASLYPNTAPPPTFPASFEREPHPTLAPAGYGYGFGWSGGPGAARPMYGRSPVAYGPYGSGLDDSDRLSTGWSINGNVGMTSRSPTIPSRNPSPRPMPEPASPAPSMSHSNGLGLFSSIRQRMFPGVTWAESRGRSKPRRRRRNSHSVRFQDYEDDEDLSEITSQTRSPRSYVPSLI